MAAARIYAGLPTPQYQVPVRYFRVLASSPSLLLPTPNSLQRRASFSQLTLLFLMRSCSLSSLSLPPSLCPLLLLFPPFSLSSIPCVLSHREPWPCSVYFFLTLEWTFLDASDYCLSRVHSNQTIEQSCHQFRYTWMCFYIAH